MAAKAKVSRFPIGFWPTGSPGDITAQMVNEWAEAGITMTYAGGSRGHMKRLLDVAHERGIRIIICDPRVAAPHQQDEGQRVPKDYRSTVQALVSDYGDLFLRIELRKAMQAGHAFGPVPTFEPDDLILSVSPLPYRLHGTVHVDPDHPFIVSRFAGGDGRQYVMIVNNSWEESVECCLAFRDPRLTVYRYARAAGPKSSPRVQPEGNIVRRRDRCEVKAWLAPGQEVVFRVEAPD